MPRNSDARFQVFALQRRENRGHFLSLILKWLPGRGSNPGAVLIAYGLAPAIDCFNGGCVTNSMHGPQATACTRRVFPCPRYDSVAGAFATAVRTPQSSDQSRLFWRINFSKKSRSVESFSWGLCFILSIISALAKGMGTPSITSVSIPLTVSSYRTPQASVVRSTVISSFTRTTTHLAMSSSPSSLIALSGSVSSAFFRSVWLARSRATSRSMSSVARTRPRRLMAKPLTTNVCHAETVKLARERNQIGVCWNAVYFPLRFRFAVHWEHASLVANLKTPLG